MKRAITLSSLGHLLVLVPLILVHLQPMRSGRETTIYPVSLIELPSGPPIKAMEVSGRVRAPEPVKSLPPVEVERIKPREKPVESEEAREVEVARETGPAEGSETEGLRIEGKGFDYPYYFEIIRRRLQSNFFQPVSGKGEERLKATIYFQITPSGVVINARVEESSGVPGFDQVAKRAVLASNPFPRLPDEYGDILGVHCDFYSAPD